MILRRSTTYLAITAWLIVMLGGLFLHAHCKVRASGPLITRLTSLVRQLELTDLCLCTEATYTRHPSMTDFSTPFQDSPLSLEHFPTGALVEPPPHLVKNNGPRN